MNDTIVSKSPEETALEVAAAPVLDRLADSLGRITPQQRKAALYILDNPNDVGLSSIREIADAAAVKPNTLVRLARAVGFEGYEDFREPFREELRATQPSFPDRARWLQSIARGGRHGRLFSEMAASTIENIEALYSETSAEEIKAAADLIVEARTTYVLGVGVLHPLAHQFAYLMRMAIDSVVATPRDGSLPMDDIARAGPEDVLLAMTFEPYRREVVEAVGCAVEQGVTVIAVTDSRAAPIVPGAAQSFVIPIETPQFFMSPVAVTAFLEMLVAFVVADARPQVIANIEQFHERRHALGVYWREEG